MGFFISNQSYVRGYQKSCPWEKHHKNAKQSCKWPDSAQKVLLRAKFLRLFFVLIFTQGGGIPCGPAMVSRWKLSEDPPESLANQAKFSK